MDPEKATRAELMGLMAGAFSCLEEVDLRMADGFKVRCDVLAIPMDAEFARCRIAFECKRPDQNWHYALWSSVLKQAADNVAAEIVDARLPEGGRVTAAFVFPAPFMVPKGVVQPTNALVRPGFEDAIAGMFHLASRFRVGRAANDPYGRGDGFKMNMGPNPVWSTRTGFTRDGRNLLLEGRPVGSRNVRY